MVKPYNVSFEEGRQGRSQGVGPRQDLQITKEIPLCKPYNSLEWHF